MLCSEDDMVEQSDLEHVLAVVVSYKKGVRGGGDGRPASSSPLPRHTGVALATAPAVWYPKCG